MFKVTSSAGKLRQAAEKVINDYDQLERDYAAIPLRDRRDLSNGLSFEAFCAAAILEGCIATRCRDVDESGRTLPSALPQSSENFVNEFSPVACPWFADLASFCARAHDETRSLTTATLAEENTHLAQIQWKYLQVKKLVASLQQPKDRNYDLELPFWIMDIYNLACEKISQGTLVPKAMEAAQTEMRYRCGQLGEDEFMANAGIRTWFPVDLTMPVWTSADPAPDFTKTSTTTTNTTLMPPPPRRLGQGTGSKALLNEYESRWKSTSPYASDIPYPNHDLTLAGFRNRARLPFPKQKVDKWSPSSIISVMVKRFFIDAVGLRGNLIAHNSDPSTATIELSRNSSYMAVKELKSILKLEATRWLPYQLNRRTGTPGQIDAGIAQGPGNAAVRMAVQELLENCVEIVGHE